MVYYHKWRSGTVVGFPGAHPVDPVGVLVVPCEVLIPAALKTHIGGRVAQHVQARLVVEAAKGPSTPEGDAVLAARGIFLVPNILANAGGVTISYFEWVQNRAGDHWSKAEVCQRLEERMVEACRTVWPTDQARGVPMRTAA